MISCDMRELFQRNYYTDKCPHAFFTTTRFFLGFFKFATKQTEFVDGVVLVFFLSQIDASNETRNKQIRKFE